MTMGDGSRGREGRMWGCAETPRDGETETQRQRRMDCCPQPGSLRKWLRLLERPKVTRDGDREAQAGSGKVRQRVTQVIQRRAQIGGPTWGPQPAPAWLACATVDVAVRDLLDVGARPGEAASPRLLVAPSCPDRVCP